MLHNPLGGAYCPLRKGISTLCTMHQLQAFTNTTEDHGMLTHNITRTESVNTYLGLRTSSNHPLPSVYCYVVQASAMGFRHNSRHP